MLFLPARVKKKLYKWIFSSLLGWRIQGTFPNNISKCVVMVMPHTSWHDFYLGLLLRGILTIEINYVAKKELFRLPFGWYFKYMGGAAVDRNSRDSRVASIAAVFKARTKFRLAIAPEGTRAKVSALRTGFYYIALEAKVPIIPVAFDYGMRLVKIGAPVIPTGNYEDDLALLCKFFQGVQGKIPENGFDCN